MKYLLPLTLSLVCVATAQETPTVAVPSETVARIGDQVITKADFDAAFRQAVASTVNRQGVGVSDELVEEFKEARADFFKKYIQEQGLLQVARKTVKLDSSDLEKRINDIKSGFSNESNFMKALQLSGYQDEQSLKNAIEKDLLLHQLTEETKKKFTFKDSLIANYYNTHKNEYKNEEQACARHILVETENAAQEISKRIESGEAFETIAKEASKDSGSAQEGGALGCFGRGVMVPTFDKASFEGPLKKLQTVRSQFGWHVLEVTDRMEAGLMSLEKAAPLIREQFSADAARKYLDSQVSRIKTEVFETFGESSKEMKPEDKKN